MATNNYKNMNVYKLNEENLTLLLKYNAYKSLFLVWGGSARINKNTKEKPLMLNLNNENIYFYSKMIEEVNNETLNNLLINSKTNNEYQLNNTEQKEVINAFGNVTNQKNPYQKITLLELQNEYLNKENEDLKKTNEEFIREKDDDNSELDLLARTNDSLIKTTNYFKKNADELLKKNTDLKNLNEMFKWEIERLSNENEDLKEENHLLHNLIKDTKKETKLFDQKMKRYEKTNENIKKNTKEITNNLTKLEEQYSKELIEDSELEWEDFDNEK